MGYDWTKDDEAIRAAIAQPLEGLLFDVENDGLWWPEWGNRPNDPNERAKIVQQVVRESPKLIPLLGHRYIPETPTEAGNPVLSIVQSDAIFYGVDLADYIRREFVDGYDKPILLSDVKTIPFWSELVVRASKPSRDG